MDHSECPSEILNEQQRKSWRAYIDGSAVLSSVLASDMEFISGLSMSEYEILVRLSEAKDGALRMSELADQLAYSRSRISHTVKRLEGLGFVSRGKSVTDKRGIDCVLTESGFAEFSKFEPMHLNNVRDRVVDVITHEELEQLGAIFRKVASRAHGAER